MSEEEVERIFFNYSQSVEEFERKFSGYFPKLVDSLKKLSRCFGQVKPKETEQVKFFSDINFGCPNFEESVCSECILMQDYVGCPVHLDHMRNINNLVSSGQLDYSNYDDVLRDLNENFDPDEDWSEFEYIPSFLVGLARSISIDPRSIGIEINDNNPNDNNPSKDQYEEDIDSEERWILEDRLRRQVERDLAEIRKKEAFLKKRAKQRRQLNAFFERKKR
jgi:hypothetical protein